MGQLALYDFLRHIKRNLFIAGLLAALCLLLTSLYSLLRYDFDRYKPFEELGIKNGYWIGMDMEAIAQTDTFEELAEWPGVAGFFTVYQSGMTVGGKYVKLYVYEDWSWKNWRGRLLEGKWFEESDLEAEAVPVIFGGSDNPFANGALYACSINGQSEVCRVKGILQPGTEIMFGNEYDIEYTFYDACYMVPEDGVYGLIQKEVADAHGLYSYPTCIWSFVKYEENLSAEEAAELDRRITRRIYSGGFPYDIFMNISKDAMKDRLFAYFPFMAIGAVLVLASLLAAAFINVEKGSKYYKVYYLVGGSKQKCFWIACGNVLGTIAVSGLFYVLLRMLLQMFTRRNNILFSLTAGANLLAAGLYLLFALFMGLCMYFAMKKNSPLELLRKHG